MHRCVQTRRGTLRTEPMPARAKPDRRSQFNFVSQLEGAKLLGILGQEVVGGREATPGHPEPVQLGKRMQHDSVFFFIRFERASFPIIRS